MSSCDVALVLNLANLGKACVDSFFFHEVLSLCAQLKWLHCYIYSLNIEQR